MDVQFRHRKLISESIKETLIAEICYQNCTQPCFPSICVKYCSGSCNDSSNGSPPPTPGLPYSADHHSTKPHEFLIITFTVLAITLLALCCYVIYVRCYLGRPSSRRRTLRQISEVRSIGDDFVDEDQGPVLDHPIWYIRTVGLPPAVIGSIAVFKYKKGDGLVEGTECSVCLNEFQEDETLRLLPKCNHAFHPPCIDTWLTAHTNCPLCRAPIVLNTAMASSPEVNREELVTGEESQIGVLEENRDSDGEPEVGSSEVRVRTEEEAEETPVQETEEAIQPIRRSVSLDSRAASKIIREIANSGDQLVKEKESRVVIVPRRLRRGRRFPRLMGSSSSGRTLQIGPVSLKRSSSYNSKSRNADLPVRTF